MSTLKFNFFEFNIEFIINMVYFIIIKEVHRRYVSVMEKVENGLVKYYSIRDGKFRLNENDIDEVVGYIACKKTK